LAQVAAMDLILWRHADAENGSPDASRKLTDRGRAQAARVAAWLKPRLPEPCDVLVSPANRAQETALALGMPFVMSAGVGTDAHAAEIIEATGWPGRAGALVVVGHQPTLGRLAAKLLTGRESDWEISKGALWWFRHAGGGTVLFAILDPELA
jgi:phosphohistidine phosphatase